MLVSSEGKRGLFFFTYQITSDEILVVKVAIGLFVSSEDAEVLCQGNQNAEEQSNVRASQTKWSSVSHLILGDALSPTRAHKEDMRDQEGDPGQQTENGGQIDKVTKHNFGIISSVHKGSAAEKRRDGQSRHGNTTLVSPTEDLGRMALLSEAVNGT